MLDRIAEGRTDLVFDYLAQGNPPNSKTSDGSLLIQWCAYYGDVSAIKFLLAKGERLQSLGEDSGLNAAAFHGNWRLWPEERMGLQVAWLNAGDRQVVSGSVV